MLMKARLGHPRTRGGKPAVGQIDMCSGVSGRVEFILDVIKLLDQGGRKEGTLEHYMQDQPIGLTIRLVCTVLVSTARKEESNMGGEDGAIELDGFRGGVDDPWQQDPWPHTMKVHHGRV
jgi:hypothetical protein